MLIDCWEISVLVRGAEGGSPVEPSRAVEALRAEHDLRVGFFSITCWRGGAAKEEVEF